MKHVSLLRHAKAAPTGVGSDDFTRPLTASGRADATLVGETTAGQVPDLILSSPSRRTTETVELVCQAWPHVPKIRYDETLYLAEWDGILEELQRLPADVDDVWVVGHNPGLHELAIELGRCGGLGILDSVLGRHFPTAARARFSFESTSWAGILDGRCRLVAFVTPR